MQLQTFSQVKASRVVQIAGVCKTSPEFKQLVNDATEILLERGDWPGLEVPMQACVRNGCVVWPRQVGRIRRLNMCNRHVHTDNFWWNYVAAGSEYNGCCGNFIDHGRLTNMGRSPIYTDIPLQGLWKIRIAPTKAIDIGKKITFFGVDTNGQTLRHKDADGIWQNGIVISLQKPHGESLIYVRSIERVIKEVTQGDVFVYGYDPARDMWLDITKYAPDETNPSYAKDSLKSCGCNCDSLKSVVALVKLQFVPVNHDNDLVLCPSPMALKFAIQAIKMGEADNDAGYVSKLLLAVNELAHTLDNETPPEDAPIDTHFRGHEYVGMQSVI